MSTMPAVVECRKPTALTMIAAIVAPARGIRSSKCHDQPEGDRVRHPEPEKHGGRNDACDEADREVPGDVAANGPVDVRAHLAPARLGLLVEKPVEPLHPDRAFEQHEQRQEGDRDDGDHGIENALRQAQRRVREAEDSADAALLDRFPCLFDDLVVALEKPEPASSPGEVVDVAGNRIREIVDLADQRRNKRRCDPDDDENRTGEHDADS